MDRILLVEDDRNTLEGLAEILSMENYDVVKAIDGKSGVRELKNNNFNVLLTDLVLPDMDGLDLATKAWQEQKEIMVIIMTAFGSVKHAVSAMKKGVFDYLTKPIDIDELMIVLKKSINQQKLHYDYSAINDGNNENAHFDDIIGGSGKMQQIFQQVDKIASSDATILIRGESGTGKELIARAIHYNSPRKNNALLELNCSSIPESLLESELFGHEKGSFTGAHKQVKGKFEAADGGTIFLDEIGELSPNVQVKLLRFLQEKRFNRVGGTSFVSVDIRLIAATNADLERALERGTFREDLYYRLNVIPIHIPALRERAEDIPPLTEHFIEKFAQKNNKLIDGIDSEALNILVNYAWPGNVRELENALENAVVMTENTIITADDLPFYIENEQKNLNLPDFSELEGMTYRTMLEQADKMIIKKALEDSNGNKTHAAKRLGFSIRTMRNKVNKYDL